MDDYKNIFGVNMQNAVGNPAYMFKGTKYRITIITDRLVRFEYSENGSFEDRPTEFAKNRRFGGPQIEKSEDDKTLVLRTKYFQIKYVKEKNYVGTKLAPDENLLVTIRDTDKVWFFEHAEARNYKGTKTSLDNAKELTGLSKGLYSTDGFVSFDDSQSLIFNEDGSVGKRKDERIDTYLFVYKKDYGYAIKDYFDLTGYPPLIPRYAYGIWWDKKEKYDTNEIYKLVSKFRKYEIPLNVIILNEWSKNNEEREFNEGFPAPEALFKELNSQDIHVGLELKLPGTKNSEGKIIPFNVFNFDYIKSYFTNVIKPLNDIGVDFYSIENKPKDLYSLRMTNYYFYNYQKALPTKRGLLLAKNGLVSSHLYPVHNSGNTLVDFKTLDMLPEFNATAANIGVTWWSHAIGGYSGGEEDNILFIRYVEFAVYNPIFRLSSKHGHYYKREPWLWDVKTRKIVRYYTNIRLKLIPYLYSEGYKYSRTGLPMIQPIYYIYPELFDEPLYKNEYYFGSEFFIAPITNTKDEIMNRTVVKLFMPSGIWYDFKTGKKFPAGRQMAFYKDEDFPVFAKQGAIIPMADLNDTNRNSTKNPSDLEIHIFPGKNNTYRLYEDDSTKESYKEGDYLISVIDYNYLPNNYTVIIRPIEGKLSVVPEKRNYKIRFRNTKVADEVLVYVGSQKVLSKNYVDDEDFVVEIVGVPTKEQLTINCKGKDIELDATRIINEDIDSIISDLKISTELKEKIASIIFSEDDVKKKRMDIIKLKKEGLKEIFIKMFLKLLDYIAEI